MTHSMFCKLTLKLLPLMRVELDRTHLYVRATAFKTQPLQTLWSTIIPNEVHFQLEKC